MGLRIEAVVAVVAVVVPTGERGAAVGEVGVEDQCHIELRRKSKSVKMPAVHSWALRGRRATLTSFLEGLIKSLTVRRTHPILNSFNC